MRSLSLLLLLGASLAGGGCLAVAAGAAGYGATQYVENETFNDYNASLPVTWAATVDSMREMGYAVPAGLSPGPTQGVIDVGDAHVRVEMHDGNRTRVRVRVGTLDSADHRRRADLIHGGIARRLGRP